MMRAITVQPGQPGSLAVMDVPEPEAGGDELLVEGLLLGVCGTDKEIAGGEYGTPPPGRDRLILGHESLGRVLRAPAASDFSSGDLVVGVVRRPDPVPCGACRHGEWDMCRNGLYTERGIKELDGYGSQRWTVPDQYAVRVDSHLGHAGPKPRLIADLGATYHDSSIADIARTALPDVVIEATGVGQLVLDAVAETASYGRCASPASLPEATR